MIISHSYLLHKYLLGATICQTEEKLMNKTDKASVITEIVTWVSYQIVLKKIISEKEALGKPPLEVQNVIIT